MTRYWIGVASADHVRRGRAGGFMQLNHGKAQPLRRVGAGDGIVYYAPTVSFRGKDRLQAFVAIGTVDAREPYQADIDGAISCYRRDVRWADAAEAPIAPLRARLAFAADGPNWGYKLRCGLFEISRGDYDVIAEAMAARLPLSAGASARMR